MNKSHSCLLNVKYVVLLILRNESEVKSKIKDVKVCLLLLIVGLMLWAKHAGLFVASFYEVFIFD